MDGFDIAGLAASRSVLGAMLRSLAIAEVEPWLNPIFRRLDTGMR